MDTTKTILAIVPHNKWPIYEMDGKSTFLNDYLEEQMCGITSRLHDSTIIE